MTRRWGAQRCCEGIAALLAERGVRAEFTLDEGLAVVDSAMFGLNRPVALVAVTEKGYLSLEPRRNNAGPFQYPDERYCNWRLGAAVTRVVNAPMPAVCRIVRLMFRYLGPEMSFPMRIAWQSVADPAAIAATAAGAYEMRLYARPRRRPLSGRRNRKCTASGSKRDHKFPLVAGIPSRR